MYGSKYEGGSYLPVLCQLGDLDIGGELLIRQHAPMLGSLARALL